MSLLPHEPRACWGSLFQAGQPAIVDRYFLGFDTARFCPENPALFPALLRYGTTNPPPSTRRGDRFRGVLLDALEPEPGVQGRSARGRQSRPLHRERRAMVPAAEMAKERRDPLNESSRSIGASWVVPWEIHGRPKKGVESGREFASSLECVNTLHSLARGRNSRQHTLDR